MPLFTSFFLAFFVSSCHITFLFLHFMSLLSFPSLRINEAADFKDHKIQVASCLISLKVEPSPALSINLSGAPLIKIVLTHILVRITHAMSQFLPIWLMFLSVICFLVWVSHTGKLECSSCWRLGVGHPPYQRKEVHGLPVATVARSPPYEIHLHYFCRSLM